MSAPDQGPRKKPILDIHPTVFWTSAVLIIGFVLATLAAVRFAGQEAVEDQFEHFKTVMAAQGGWFFILSANVFVVFIVVIAASRFGRIRLGGPQAKPEFSYPSYLAMLFSAGMGIGLLFWSVAEPLYHLEMLPWKQATEARQADLSMAVTYFHWGLHAWSIYAVMALALAFAAFNLKQPLTVRSAFYPLLGEKIHGWRGNLIDILAVISTLFGVATSLGLGAKQVHAGIVHLTGLGGGEHAILVQILLIVVITGMATTSVVLGLDGGIRRISEITVILGFLLLLFVFVMGPTVFLLDGLVQNVGSYLINFLKLSFYTETYKDTGEQGSWQASWTIFYWAWWIAWSPFVGMFIARISKGYTVRTMILSVLLIPTLVTFAWLSIFGNAAIYNELFGTATMSRAVHANISVALFELLELYPLATLSSVLAMIVIILFFVTSSDSGSLVIDIITAGGNLDPPVIQRIFWAILEGVVAIALLLGGGLIALQTASIMAGLPFAFVLIVMCVSLWKGLAKATESRPASTSNRQEGLEELEGIPPARQPD